MAFRALRGLNRRPRAARQRLVCFLIGRETFFRSCNWSRRAFHNWRPRCRRRLRFEMSNDSRSRFFRWWVTASPQTNATRQVCEMSPHLSFARGSLACPASQPWELPAARCASFTSPSIRIAWWLITFRRNKSSMRCTARTSWSVRD